MSDQDDQLQSGDQPQVPQIPLDENGMPDFSKIDPSMLPPMPAVDKALAERVIMLYKDVDASLKGMNLDPDERKKIEQNLMEAISAELLMRLSQKMSDEDKDELTGLAEHMDTKKPDLAEVAGFFKDRFEQKDLVEALAGATETVLSEFAESMQQGNQSPE